MDFCRNVPEPLAFHSEYQPEPALSPDCSKPGCHSASLDDLFPSENTESDVSLEWLSIFVEDCLSSSGNCIPPPPPPIDHHNSTVPSIPCLHQTPPPKLQDFSVPAKPRTKRKRAPTPTTLLTSLSHHLHPQSQITSDPPLLHQAYWLADSELIVPKKEDKYSTSSSEEEEEEEEEEKEIGSKVEGSAVMKENSGSWDGGNGQARRCTHCLAQRTPQWRAGPLGPKTLCNACGVRFKSGRLLPEYRPAKSPTFVSYKHSNSHKKVMEMRMSILSSVSTE